VVKKGRRSAVPSAVLQKLQDKADGLTNKNQWDFKLFEKEVAAALKEFAEQHPSNAEVPVPCKRTLKTMFTKMCPLKFKQADQQNLGRYIAGVDLLGQASMVSLLPVLYDGKDPSLIMNIDASNVRISVGSPPDKKPSVQVSRKAAARCRNRGVGMGKTGGQQFKFRTAKLLTLISQRHLVNATYVLKAKNDSDKIDQLKLYSVRGLSNRGPNFKGHIIVVPKDTPLKQVVKLHLNKVVVPAMKKERTLIAEQRASARAYAMAAAEEDNDASSPRLILDPADLSEPMALIYDGEKTTLDVISDDMKDEFKEASVDLLKGYKRGSYLWQANDTNRAGFKAVKRICLRASEELGDMFLDEPFTVPPPDGYTAQTDAIMDNHFTGLDSKLYKKLFAAQPAALGAGYGLASVSDAWFRPGMAVPLDFERIWNQNANWQKMTHELKEKIRALAKPLGELGEAQGYTKVEQLYDLGIPRLDDTDPFVKEWLEKARQGENAKPAEDRDDSEGYAILTSHSGAREKRQEKKAVARLAEAAKEQKRKEAAQRAASRAAGQPGKKHLTARSPCAAQGLSQCGNKYSRGTGSICDHSNCGVWFCPSCGPFADAHTTVAHEETDS
jgi:hypothetical protein